MNKKIIKKAFFCIFFLIINLIKVYSQNAYNIDYYGVVSTELDSNLYKMTSDLYFTQLSEINSFFVTDKRDSDILEKEPDPSLFSNSNLTFYAIIAKDSNSSTWITTLKLVDVQNNFVNKTTKEYDSYYKILMEPKSVLQESLRELITKKGISTTTKKVDTNKKSEGISISSLEVLSGNWTGEKGISKIVIMRGGRGFVIFDNGASMNISLSLSSSNKVTITQVGKSNASFFPDIPRNIALTEALSAPPIKWTFSLTSNDTLSGEKESLIMSDNKAIIGNTQIKWTKID